MNPDKTIESCLPTLKSIAFSLVRSKADAEDIVQDTFVKWLSLDMQKIRNTKAYLIKSVKNNCLNHLKKLRQKKEEYLETINFSEIIERYRFKEISFSYLDLEVELLNAFKVLQSKLEPVERAVYLLKEVFDFDYESLQKILSRTKDNCRQILCRARKKLTLETVKVNFDFSEASRLFSCFKKSFESNNLSYFIAALRKDMMLSGGTKK